jgi:nitrite reductase/ring-hydroxylating ferredoxin subunit
VLTHRPISGKLAPLAVGPAGGQTLGETVAGHAMLTAEQNRLITETGPGTPCGALMRRYWQPAALVEELATPRPVKRVRLLGEDLVLFRDPAGRYGLLHRHCAHRGADLSFGRCEDGGLRCPFHGWLYDAGGVCLEQPAEPAGSTFHRKVRQPAYPCIERGGIVWAYMGPGEPPPFAALDCFTAPDTHVFAFKGLWSCNWLQALEVGIDPGHASFLHRFFEDEELSDGNYGRQFRAATIGADIPMSRLLREVPNPRLDSEETPFGLRIITRRPINDAVVHLRITNMVFPHAFVIPLSREMSIIQWHAPVDDTRCYWYCIFISFAAPVDKSTMRAQRLANHRLPDYVPHANRSNDWGYDPDEQRTKTYTGMGMDINVHDQWAVESMGAIQDRTKEHLGYSDRIITAARRLIFRAIDDVAEGRDPPLTCGAEAVRGPATIDAVVPIEGVEEYWQTLEASRRRATPWLAETPAPA